jgi:hypothetical protein
VEHRIEKIYSSTTEVTKRARQGLKLKITLLLFFKGSYSPDKTEEARSSQSHHKAPLSEKRYGYPDLRDHYNEPGNDVMTRYLDCVRSTS